MIIPITFETIDSSYAFAVALFLDAYTNADSTILYLPKRSRDNITNPKLIPHLPIWSEQCHTAYRKLPVTMDLEQFVVLDDGWAASTLDLVRTQFAGNLNAAARVAFYMWKSILFWGHYSQRQYATGFITTAGYAAKACRCSERFASKVILAMLDVGLIHRKWIGSGLAKCGSCYLPGSADSLQKLLS